MANIIFMGTPDFAVPALRALHTEFGVTTVVTVPDKPRGRGLQIVPSAVKVAAEELGITDILQPVSLKENNFTTSISERNPDIICVIAFRILPRAVYSLAQLGSFNVHASLLPEFRGAAPIHHAILSGATETGVTSFLLNDVVDTGTILRQTHYTIPDGTTTGELYQELMPLAATCAVETCRDLINGTARPTPQDDSRASLAPKVYREFGNINWRQDRKTVRQHILGYSPVPCAWTRWNDETVKMYRAEFSDATLAPGTWEVRDNTLLAGCQDGALSITEIQLPGKPRRHTADVLRGYRGALHGEFL
ncbi:MAG TPA: methionyl-tRNA formyltransferase [Chlorobiota bacterium]|nr:methionyl-tRNA formyltransferase [Chlorobiota bacterium]